MRRGIARAAVATTAGVALITVGIAGASASRAALRGPRVAGRTSRAPLSPGAQVWASRYNGSGNGYDIAESLALRPSGETVFVTGFSNQGTATGFDYATVAYNAATGAQLWVKHYHGSGSGNDIARSAAVSPDGGTLFVTGYSGGAASGEDYATIAYNAATGAQRWVSSYNGSGNGGDSAFSVAVSPSGGTVFVTGDSDGKATGADVATVAYSG